MTYVLATQHAGFSGEISLGVYGSEDEVYADLFDILPDEALDYGEGPIEVTRENIVDLLMENEIEVNWIEVGT
jgi:hypothetical protein